MIDDEISEEVKQARYKAVRKLLDDLHRRPFDLSVIMENHFLRNSVVKEYDNVTPTDFPRIAAEIISLSDAIDGYSIVVKMEEKEEKLWGLLKSKR